MPIDPVYGDDDISNAMNIARQSAGADPIQAKISGLNQFMTGLDLEANPFNPHTGLNSPSIGGTGMPRTIKLSDIALENNISPKELGQSFTGLKKTSVPYENWSYVTENPKKMLPKPVFDVNQLKPGDVLQPFFGDRSPAGYDITEINGQRLDVPVTAEGGSDHALMNVNQTTGSPLNRQSIWKSGNSVISSLANRANRGQAVSRWLGYDDPNVYGVHVAMGPHAQDFSTHTTEALLGTLKQNPISEYDLDAFDQFMKDKNVHGKAQPEFPGIRSEELRDWLLDTNNGAARLKFSKGMDQDYFRSKGFPEVGPARFATTHPELAAVPTYASGHMITHMDMSDPIEKEFTSSNRSYPTDLIGTALGRLAALPHKDVVFPDFSKSINENPPVRNVIPAKYKNYLSGNAFQIVTPEYQDYLGNEIEKMVRNNRNDGGRTLGNNAIGNAMRMALGGDAEIEMPHSLKELQDWKKNHPTPVPQPSMDDVFTNRVSGFEGAPPIAMPSNLDELLAYLRKHHASGGRAHFDDGGDAGGGGDQGGGDNPRADSLAQSQQASADAQAAADNRANNQDVGRFSFGNNFNVGNTNETGVSTPSGFQDYTQQRLDAENNYQGSLLNAAMYPSQAFGMSYPNLVNVENTRAGAAGLLGSGMGESGKGLDPSAMNAGSIGMFQDTGERAAALKAALGVDPSLRGNALRDALSGTQMGQLGFGLNEIVSKPDYAATAQAMASGTNAADVANTVMRNFERPSEANQVLSGPMREAYAQNIMAGNPSGATLGIGSYDATPSSYMAALMSGVKQADLQNQATPHQYANDATLAQSVMSDASNDPAVTAARNAAIAAGQDSTTANQPNILERIFGSTQDQIDKLAAEGKYAGMDKQQYADQFAGGDPNAVKERIIYDNGQPKVDYYTKDLSQALFGDPLKALTSGLGNLFSQKQNYDPLTGQYRPDISASVGQQPSSFGGRGGGQQDVINQAVAAATPQSVTAPYITQLGTYNAQLPSTTGQTAEQWAAANTGGDLSKVNGRIKYVNGAPMLEYYTQ